jgi:hypothetical protein
MNPESIMQNRCISMDVESQRISPPSTPTATIWTKLAQIFHPEQPSPQICFKTNTLYLKNGIEIDLLELKQAIDKYCSIYNINSHAAILQSGFNKLKVRYFLLAIEELMEYVISEQPRNPFIQSLLTDIVQFYDLQKVVFETPTNCYMRIIHTSETLNELLKVDSLQ